MQERNEKEYMLDVQALSPPAVCMHPTRGWYFLLLQQLLPSPHMNRLILPPLHLSTLHPWSSSHLQHAPEQLGTSLPVIL